MPACPPSALRCRACETEHAARAGRRLLALLRAARPVYDRDELGADAAPARRSRPARRRSGATRRSCPSRRRPSRGSRPGLTPLVAAPAARRRRSASASSTSSSTPRTRRTRSRTGSSRSPRAKAQELGRDDARLLLDRQPRERRRRARGRRGDRGGRLLPGRPRAREADGDRRLRRDASTRSTARYDDCSRLTVELSFELDWAFVNVGLRSLLRRGLEDARVRDRRAARLASSPTWSSAPIASGALFSKVHQGFGELLELGLVEGDAAAPRTAARPRAARRSRPRSPRTAR